MNLKYQDLKYQDEALKAAQCDAAKMGRAAGLAGNSQGDYCTAQQQDTREIPRELTLLGDAIERLEKTAFLLGERLAPTTGPLGDAERRTEERPMLTSYGAAVQGLRVAVERSICRLAALESNCQV